MRFTRRQAGSLLPAAFAPCAFADQAKTWNGTWDRAVLTAALEGLDDAYDPAGRMLARNVGGEYRYHTNLRNMRAHPTRDSLEYGLLLLEAGRDERAREVIGRVTALQETDAASKWYGIWGYYLEEPAPKMSPADWNWADFNGSLLLLIDARHGAKLPESLRRAVRQAIGHAAYSVRRRNVSMTYTNIAVQGTFVTLAAASALGDADLRRYAVERLHRFAATVDETGSFAEYNSPTYANVTIANLTRIRMLVRDEGVMPLVEKLHHRAWLHLAKHWHAPSRQLAGPMSRSYSTDIGQPLWIQKALGGRLEFASLEDVRRRNVRAPGEVALLDYRCPEDLAPLFLGFAGPRQHREWFLPNGMQGTTWMEHRFSLGSANRGDFWVQRRPLVAYWKAGWMQARVIKDDYDFTSALFYSVQERNYLLGLVNFRSPGGDKHPSLDPVRDASFEARRLRLRFDFAGVPERAAVIETPEAVAVDAGPVKVWIGVRAAVFGEQAGRVSVMREDGVLAVSVDWLREPGTVRWREVKEAYAAFTLAVEAGGGTLADFARGCRAMPFAREGAVNMSWKTPAGELGLAGAAAVAPVAAQDAAFRETVNGRPVPRVRLSEEKLS